MIASLSWISKKELLEELASANKKNEKIEELKSALAEATQGVTDHKDNSNAEKLLPREDILATENLYQLGKKYFESKGFPGKFRATVIMDDSLNISYVDSNGRSKEIFWMKK